MHNRQARPRLCCTGAINGGFHFRFEAGSDGGPNRAGVLSLCIDQSGPPGRRPGVGMAWRTTAGRLEAAHVPSEPAADGSQSLRGRKPRPSAGPLGTRDEQLPDSAP